MHIGLVFNGKIAGARKEVAEKIVVDDTCSLGAAIAVNAIFVVAGCNVVADEHLGGPGTVHAIVPVFKNDIVFNTGIDGLN